MWLRTYLTSEPDSIQKASNSALTGEFWPAENEFQMFAFAI